MVSVYSDTPPFVVETSALKFSPSAADRWFNCPGSASVSAVLRSPSSIYAREGTAGHMVLEHLFKYPELAPGDERRMIGQEWIVDMNTKEVHKIDADMFHYGFQSRASILNDLSFISDEWINLEQFLTYNNGGLSSRGRADLYVIDPRAHIVIDYKYGQGEIVEAIGNLQGGNYLCAMRQKFGPRDRYYFGVLQPRGRGRHPERIRWWVLNNEQLDKFEKNMVAAMDRAKYFPVPYISGKWCRYCPGKGMCPAWSADLLQSVLFEKCRPTGEPNLWALDHADAIKKYLKQLESDTFARIDAGESIRGWGIATTRGNRKWIDGVEEKLVVRAIENGWAKKDVIKTEEKVVGIGVAEDELGINTDGLTEKPEKRKLVKTENNEKDASNGFTKI